MRILGIETSCDETAVAYVEHQNGRNRVLGSLISSQTQLHAPFGGVVPELATREHLRNLPLLVRQIKNEIGFAWNEVDAIAATRGPGLAPALLIGHSYAQALALSLNRPFFGVNHLEGHLYSPFLTAGQRVEFPLIGLIVSGGHTLLIEAQGWNRYRKLGGTCDDAAGEAFDKVARLLKLGYPGGPEIERLSRAGNPEAYSFPRSFPERDNYNFSFSGLKTALRYYIDKNPKALEDPVWVSDLCASFQEAIIQVLVRKTQAAAEGRRVRLVVASGGVLSNERLRGALSRALNVAGIQLLMANKSLCTDNAAMIAFVAAEKMAAGLKDSERTDIQPALLLSES